MNRTQGTEGRKLTSFPELLLGGVLIVQLLCLQTQSVLVVPSKHRHAHCAIFLGRQYFCRARGMLLQWWLLTVIMFNTGCAESFSIISSVDGHRGPFSFFQESWVYCVYSCALGGKGWGCSCSLCESRLGSAPSQVRAVCSWLQNVHTTCQMWANSRTDCASLRA